MSRIYIFQPKLKNAIQSVLGHTVHYFRLERHWSGVGHCALTNHVYVGKSEWIWVGMLQGLQSPQNGPPTSNQCWQQETARLGRASIWMHDWGWLFDNLIGIVFTWLFLLHRIGVQLDDVTHGIKVTMEITQFVTTVLFTGNIDVLDFFLWWVSRCILVEDFKHQSHVVRSAPAS